MAKGPKWFQELPKETQNNIEQAGHFLWGFAESFVFADRIHFWWREFVKQAPIERLWDTKADLLWFRIGGTCGDITKTALLVWWII
jgi:hypothetical protein